MHDVTEEEEKDELDELENLITGAGGEEVETEAEEGEEETGAGDEDFNLDEIDLDSLADQFGDMSEMDLDEGETEETEESSEEESEVSLDELNLDDLDLELDELEEEASSEFEPKVVLNGEIVLLLGGEAKHQADYLRVVEELGGTPEWIGNLDDYSEDDIAEIVERSDLIMTLSSDAVSDPGILKATNLAQENNKRVFHHHSSNPLSVQKQLIKLVEEGKV